MSALLHSKTLKYLFISEQLQAGLSYATNENLI